MFRWFIPLASSTEIIPTVTGLDLGGFKGARRKLNGRFLQIWPKPVLTLH